MGNFPYLYIWSYRTGAKAEMANQLHPITKIIFSDIVLQHGQCPSIAPCETRAPHTQFYKYFFHFHFPLVHLCQYRIHLPYKSQEKQEKGISNAMIY